MTNRKHRRSISTHVQGTSAVAPDEDDSSPRTVPADIVRGLSWRVFLQLTFTALVFLFVFWPWLSRLVEGQFIGLTGEYGTDFFRYYMGSEALLRFDADPYSNAQMFQLLESEQLTTDHPNPMFDAQTSIKAFGPTPDPVAKGVVSPPFLLVVLMPLVSLMGFTWALNLCIAATFMLLLWLVCLYWRTLSPTRAGVSTLASQSAVASILVFSGFPVLWTAIYGQFEALYVAPLGIAIYLWSFHRERKLTPLWVGMAVAVAGAIKLYPLLLLGYFAWQLCGPTDGTRETAEPQPLMRRPEWKVMVFSLVCFVGLHGATAAALGMEVFPSFAAKVRDLQFEGAGPSMKGNLLSYLNFSQVWRGRPFMRMQPPHWLYAGIATAVVALAMWTTRPSKFLGDGPQERSWRSLLHLSLWVSIMPTVLPHWWIYYNVVLIFPFIVCFIAAHRAEDVRVRRWMFALIVSALVLNYSYLTTSLLFRTFPAVREWLVNQSGVDALRAQLESDPALMENLPYSRAFGEPYLAELEGRVPSVFNIAFGYPGAALLTAANLIGVCCAYSSAHPLAHPLHSARVRPAGTRWRPWGRAVGWIAASCLGAYGLVSAGEACRDGLPEVEFVYADPRGAPEMDRIAAPPTAEGELARALVFELADPSHFFDWLREQDADLARALEQQDAVALNSPEFRERLTRRFYQHERDLDSAYVLRQAATSRAPPEWRCSDGSALMLHELERVCQRRKMDLRRVPGDFYVWQAAYGADWQWRRLVDALRRRDVRDFTRRLFAHRDAMTYFERLRMSELVRVKALAPLEEASSSPRRILYGLVQMPSKVTLTSYPAVCELTTSQPLERGIITGTAYIAEEVIRRGHFRKHKNPTLASAFAAAQVQGTSRDRWVNWWSSPASLDADGDEWRTAFVSSLGIDVENLQLYEDANRTE